MYSYSKFRNREVIEWIKELFEPQCTVGGAINKVKSEFPEDPDESRFITNTEYITQANEKIIDDDVWKSLWDEKINPDIKPTHTDYVDISIMKGTDPFVNLFSNDYKIANGIVCYDCGSASCPLDIYDETDLISAPDRDKRLDCYTKGGVPFVEEYKIITEGEEETRYCYVCTKCETECGAIRPDTTDTYNVWIDKALSVEAYSEGSESKKDYFDGLSNGKKFASGKPLYESYLDESYQIDYYKGFAPEAVYATTGSGYFCKAHFTEFGNEKSFDRCVSIHDKQKNNDGSNNCPSEDLDRDEPSCDETQKFLATSSCGSNMVTAKYYEYADKCLLNGKIKGRVSYIRNDWSNGANCFGGEFGNIVCGWPYPMMYNLFKTECDSNPQEEDCLDRETNGYLPDFKVKEHLKASDTYNIGTVTNGKFVARMSDYVEIEQKGTTSQCMAIYIDGELYKTNCYLSAKMENYDAVSLAYQDGYECPCSVCENRDVQHHCTEFYKSEGYHDLPHSGNELAAACIKEELPKPIVHKPSDGGDLEIGYNEWQYASPAKIKEVENRKTGTTTEFYGQTCEWKIRKNRNGLGPMGSLGEENCLSVHRKNSKVIENKYNYQYSFETLVAQSPAEMREHFCN